MNQAYVIVDKVTQRQKRNVPGNDNKSNSDGQV